MRKRLPSPAMVVACTALAVALGGTSYAAIKLPKDSVKAKQIAPNAVRSSELANDSVGTAEVIDGSLLAADFASGQLPAGAQGPQGAPGPKGDTGDRGPSEAFVKVVESSLNIVDGGAAEPVATLTGLPAGSYLILANVPLYRGVGDSLSDCTLTVGTTAVTKVAGLTAAIPDIDLVWQETVDLPAGGNVVLACRDHLGVSTGDAGVQRPTIVAIRVGSVTVR